MNTNYIIVAIIAVIVVLGLGWYLMSGNMEGTMVEENTPAGEMTDVEGNMEGGDEMAMEEGVMVGGAAMLPSRTIVENAVNAENLTTLVAAVQAAGLVDVLSSEGPFTVFAPTNEAFAALPEGTVETLLMPENQAKLQAVLTYHVVPGAITSDEIEDGETFTTVNGKTITITVNEEGNYVINGKAVITTADVIDSNGVSHVINAVLLPPADGAEAGMEG